MTADSLAAARRDHREQMHVATAARQAAEAGLEGQRNARKAAERALRRAVRRAWKPSSTSREAGRTTRQRTGKEAFETNIPPRARSPQVPKQRATQPVQSWIKSKDRDCLKSFGDINEWHTVMLHDWGRRRIVMNTLRATALLVSLPRAIRTALSGPRIAVEKSDWISFRDRFVTGEGRVVDNGNGGVSHTEAQGCGMLFAVTFDDRDTFELISGWTERVLRRQTDSLHAWRYLPDAQEHVPDTNNATDGDLIIAFSHARAAQRWRLSKSKRTAAAIARDVINLLVREVAGRTILLPAAKGFVKDDVVIVNPSYYVFPAFTALAPLLPSFRWDKLVADGVALIAEGRFGKWHLPPDWLAINTRDGLLAPASGWPPARQLCTNSLDEHLRVCLPFRTQSALDSDTPRACSEEGGLPA